MQKIILSLIMILFILIIIYTLTKKYKLTKKQSLIFWILVLFWSSVSITRAYRKVYAIDPLEIGGLGLEINLAIQITAAYGLISFILRFPLFIFSDIFEKKKIFIQIAMFFMFLSSIVVFLKPNYNTLYISSIAMGFCASMLAIFNVMFSETFSKENASISASILSSAPLLAEFIAAPIQYAATFLEYKNYSYLWLISSIIALITLFLTFSFEDIKIPKKELALKKLKFVITHKSFMYICIIAFMQSIVKFSTSGPNMIAYNKNILEMKPSLLAFSDTMFAMPQLIASILVGTYFSKKIGLEKTLRLGIISCLMFFITIIFTNNQYVSFLAYIFNGFGYGLIYISLLSIAMQYFDISYRNISMGVFQLFFSAGIYYGDSIYKLLNKFSPNNHKTVFIIALIICILNTFFINFKILFEEKYKRT